MSDGDIPPEVQALRSEIERGLSDPTAVHYSMVKGTIAKPSIAQICHVYTGQLVPAIEVQALVGSAIGLKGIVAGVQGAMEHGTFRAERSNLRMKDTDECVAFYNALAAWENRNG